MSAITRGFRLILPKAGLLYVFGDPIRWIHRTALAGAVSPHWPRSFRFVLIRYVI